MTIDPKLFKKYTGKMPGEAMNRLGQSLAKQSARDSADDTSFLGSLGRGRRRVMICGGILVAAAVVYLIATGGM